MAYAFYIDESGDFREGESPGAGSSLVAGWLADHDDDHDNLRQQFMEWYGQMEPQLPGQDKEYHACKWRKTEMGRKLLSEVFDLICAQKPVAVFALENKTRSTSENADSTYLDMLVEIIITALFYLMKKRRGDEAINLIIYIAERKGLPDWEIRKLVMYRFRMLMGSSEYRSRWLGSDSFNVFVRALKKPPSALPESASRRREKNGLMPELILADFLCNSLFQLPRITEIPSPFKSVDFMPASFERDSFLRVLSSYRDQGRFTDMVLELKTPEGMGWLSENPDRKSDYEALVTEAMTAIMSAQGRVRKLITSIDVIIRYDRNWDYAKTLMDCVEEHIGLAPEYLRPYVQWNLAQFRLVIANHTGNHKEAAQRFDQLQDFLGREAFQRTEFLMEAPENYNRHAVSITDVYAFDKARKILEESVALEEKLLKVEFSIQGRQFIPSYSDSLGRIYSTLGQLQTKLAVRDSTLSQAALDCFNLAEKHLQQSFEGSRLRNYRVEALLAGHAASNATEIYRILCGGNAITPENLFDTVGFRSFDTMYWMRWLLLPGNDSARDFIKVLFRDRAQKILELNGRRYPEMSILYYFGQLALEQSNLKIAREAWEKAVEPGLSFKQAGVLQTLALRPLCQLAIHVNKARDRAVDSIRSILESIQSGSVLNAEYFKAHFDLIPKQNYEIESNLLEKLRDDIPFS
jgi:hypothetical protein